MSSLICTAFCYMWLKKLHLHGEVLMVIFVTCFIHIWSMVALWERQETEQEGNVKWFSRNQRTKTRYFLPLQLQTWIREFVAVEDMRP